MNKVRTLTFHRPIKKDELREANNEIQRAKRKGEKVEIFWAYNRR